MAAIPGMSAGWYVPGTAPQGVLLNTPRNNSLAGGPQYYDERYATQRATPQVNQQLNGLQSSMARGYNGMKPGFGQRTSTGGGTGTPNTSYGLSTGYGSQGFGQTGQISTSIQPQGIYEPWMTSHAVSQLQADQLRGADPFYAQKQFDRPGVSRSAGTLSAALPGIAQRRAASREIGAAVPLEDAIANTGNVLGGQIEREQEALGYGSLYARILAGQLGFNRAQQGQQTQDIGTIGSLLAGIYGG